MPLTIRTIRTIRPVVAIALPIALMTVHAPAHAAGTKQACVDASSEGQTLRDGAKLIEARTRFLACARDECPSVVRRYCVEWLADAERRIPTVIFRAQTADGADVTGAQVSVDGALVHEPLGTAIPLDPGEHSVHVERAGGNPIDARIVIIDGEKGRIVPLRFAPAPAPPSLAHEAAPPAESRPLFSTATWALGGIGVVGLVVFAGFAVKASADLSDLRQTCAPYCPSNDLDVVKREALAADISLGIGVVGLGAAAITLVVNHGAATTTGAILDVRPVAGGGVGQIGVRF
jgi:hypothetical protein